MAQKLPYDPDTEYPISIMQAKVAAACFASVLWLNSLSSHTYWSPDMPNSDRDKAIEDLCTRVQGILFEKIIECIQKIEIFGLCDFVGCHQQGLTLGAFHGQPINRESRVFVQALQEAHQDLKMASHTNVLLGLIVDGKVLMRQGRVEYIVYDGQNILSSPVASGLSRERLIWAVTPNPPDIRKSGTAIRSNFIHKISPLGPI